MGTTNGAALEPLSPPPITPLLPGTEESRGRGPSSLAALTILSDARVEHLLLLAALAERKRVPANRMHEWFENSTGFLRGLAGTFTVNAASPAPMSPALQETLAAMASAEPAKLRNLALMALLVDGIPDAALQNFVMQLGLTQSDAPAGSSQKDRRCNLSVREREIVALVAQGLKNKEMAESMFISEQTVKNHLHNIFDKLGVSDRLELALYAIHKGLHLGGSCDQDGPESAPA